MIPRKPCMHRFHRRGSRWLARALTSTLSSALGLALASASTLASPALGESARDTAPAPGTASQTVVEAPWREGGFTAREAAAHVLDRLGYGALPGDIDRVTAMGIDRWLSQQLFDSHQPSEALEERLEKLVSHDLTPKEMEAKFPTRSSVFRLAVQEGIIDDPDLIERFSPGSRRTMERGSSGTARQKAPERSDPSRINSENRLPSDERRKVFTWARDRGFLPQRRAHEELAAQKVFRARYSDNQLQEVLSDFWFNHFNVSITDRQARIYVWPYERDAIRPHVLGNFRDMLGATAKHPAMLHYLDNATSVAGDDDKTTLDQRLDAFGRRGARIKARLEQRKSRRGDRRPRGLNENYARELMELHTLGVDGGYDQNDVIEVARAFTGWTVFPANARRGTERELGRMRRTPEAGFVVEDSFVFRADAHDAGAKEVLGHRLAAGRGIEDGREVLDILAGHPSTAHHLAGKLARRFISDSPPEGVVDRLAEVFLRTDGDLQKVMVALVESPEFWALEATRAKIKSPFELAMSSLRALGADLADPRPLAKWIEEMGQPLYAYQAPTGYPDRAEAWVNTGALLRRMNFSLELATGRIAGTRFDLLALNDHREPASLDEALRAYLPLLLPERDTHGALARLGPVVRDPRLAAKMMESTAVTEAYEISDADTEEWEANATVSKDRRIRPPEPSPDEVNSRGIAHVVGVILGSPEFQRR
ncbi:MAG: DUF1800 domain-containing protein [Acidobacteriota bacterium]